MKKFVLLSVLFLQFTINVFSQTGSSCWREISAGENFNLAIKTDGTLWGWGANSNQLGLGYFGNQNFPIQIGTANDWQTVSAGTFHSLAVKSNGTLWAWGNGQFGQLGNGAFNNATWNVTQLGIATDWQSVSAGNKFSIAIKTTGTLWSWGLNNSGQLGDGSLIDSNLPNQLGTANNWQSIDAGDKHSLAININGDLFAWGDNTFGQLGDGTNSNSLIPILVYAANPATGLVWQKVSAGLDHSMILNSFGYLYTCGNNNNGQLCNGNNTASNVFNIVAQGGAAFFYIDISAGSGHSLAVRNSNTLWASGGNLFKQLAQGNQSNSNILLQVGSGNNWFKVSAGNQHSVAMDFTTSLWSAGRDWEGQTGVGTNIMSYGALQNVVCPITTLAVYNLSKTFNDLKIYPNPSTGIFNLKLPQDLQIEIYNNLGQLLSSEKMLSGANTINISDKAAGVYFLKANDGNNVSTFKIIKN